MAISMKAARVNAGLTQIEVAEKVGKTKGTIASYEAYATTPDIMTAQVLAELYGMSINDIKWTKG